ncbi:flavin reductase family protein [Curtobacterium flaccumfaciens]|uniref:flavin reductase family protein n=1 Tax=Curtobacterium flaccumfaciens TaxID=2035 RepID=UPI002175F18B|nr:flavin reductase family protein [Curtobacterium flaccumfaciens]MCS5495185.1 flavin reductase family protein [Curtobacterium flaccumfaciens pv. flaccumfaciens]MCX2798167.1 flavin reductase family protein [Curtobacterium flaccumfaciens pv. flaccumfaciens]
MYEPAAGHGLPHDPFNAIVGPRPIGWVGTEDKQGRRNLAPYSFFNAFNYVPPIVGFASIGEKDSVSNARATGAFTWNLATRRLAEAMNASSVAAPHGVDEFELAGLATAPSRMIGPPRVAASPVSFECRVSQIIRLQGADGELVDSWLVLGEVVVVHIDERLLVDGVYDTAAADPILRGGGPADYFRIIAQERFQMRRPPQ